MDEQARQLILIAEDNKVDAEQLRLFLTASGFDTLHASDGREAAEMLESHFPDLIIVDVLMPRMNGFELCQYIKNHERLKTIPVLLLTALTSADDLIEGLKAGADNFISKPYDKIFLFKIINRLLSKSKSYDDPQTKILDFEFKGSINKLSSFLLAAYETAIIKSEALEKSDAKLRELIRSLEQKVEERTHELAEATKKAERSDQLKSVFLSNMSHDLRTPMNAIVGFAELLKEESITSDEKLEYLDLISKNGENLLSLIDDIIDISKIEAGEINLQVTKCPVDQILEELESHFNRLKSLKAKNKLSLRLNKKGTLGDLVIASDPIRFKQIMSNLIGNAIKYTKEGSIEFGYKIKNEFVEFYVEDTGIGISKKDADVIFERFVQAKESDTSNLKGTGLGLAICKNLVGIQGGKIWVESQLGIGSIFYFTLPYKPLEGPVLDHFPKVRKLKEIYDFKKKYILIVEDDLSNHNYLKAVLTKANAMTLWAQDGEKAIEMCKNNNTIELVLMDIHLPKISGYDATRAIKKINPDLPVLAQTAYAMSGEEEKSYEAGCDDYMAKPIKPELILSKVEKYLFSK